MPATAATDCSSCSRAAVSAWCATTHCCPRPSSPFPAPPSAAPPLAARSPADVGFTGGGEHGLLGLAFHPGFASNGHVYVSYSDVHGDTIVVRFTMRQPGRGRAHGRGPGQTCLGILRVDQDFTNHNGGNIRSAPDGYLYFGLGDGGSGGDPCNRGQTLNPANLNNAATAHRMRRSPIPTAMQRPIGLQSREPCSASCSGSTSTARLLPAATDCAARASWQAANYAIPGSNPFNGADPASACDEVWSYGLRNPWRFSFDRLTDDLYHR